MKSKLGLLDREGLVCDDAGTAAATTACGDRDFQPVAVHRLRRCCAAAASQYKVEVVVNIVFVVVCLDARQSQFSFARPIQTPSCPGMNTPSPR